MQHRDVVGLHVEDSLGAGQRALLLHSSGLSGRQWRRLADQLAGVGMRVLVPDLTGQGRSDTWPEPTPFSFRTDVERVVALLKGGPAHVVGHSYGGFIALKVAVDEPALVQSLLLYEPTAFGVLDARDRDAEAALNSVARRWGSADGDRERWLRTFVDFWTGSGGWRSLQEAARAEFRRVGWVLHEGARTMLQDATVVSAYAVPGRPPTLLLRGSESPLPALRVVDRLGEGLPGSRIVTIQGAGHMGPVTHGGAVNGAIVEMLDSVGAL